MRAMRAIRVIRVIRAVWQWTGIVRLPATMAFMGWYGFFGITSAPLGGGLHAEDILAAAIALAGFTGSSLAFEVWEGWLSKIFRRFKETS